ncbi:DUF5403 family protein [Kocuria massiliensis]|uniref:DUF5403 family protein n=1 Tax=Kocuria massiliensis TaxID=1926282 RepID=UPI0022B99EFC|nr:DUF5403 family protein [Kocuria massiliensis]
MQVFKRSGTMVAKMVGDSSLFTAEADKLAVEVKGNIAPHNDTTEFFNSIKVGNIKGQKGVTDRMVYSDDPHALSKEYGHKTPNGGKVDGIHAFAKAKAM